ncbi:ATP-binding protein [Paracoccus aestuariivivens]|uniref:AAA family ATPase n=1 Tax=Paracoccus aestuariivivens TaxID=1820333 RepID=A0A6L6JA87_9RHOB|nr:adenylate/guanylate cyclase domain-containing protein [Paracoccus aestuariivivens]MTH76891.1 AAA family ATPase [Paracoccus aestuariivivens]
MSIKTEAPNPELTTTGPFQAEHRGISVLFADLVGSTDHVEALGPEAYADLLRSFHGLCNHAIRKHNGTVAQYLGDGILVYFGYPYAGEDDAARAIDAALEIFAALSARAKTASIQIQSRIGIATGSALIQTGAKDIGANAVGTCINKAARLEALAEPGTILICDDTRKLVGELFQLRQFGRHPLKGLKGEHTIFRAEKRRTGIATRFTALRGRRRHGLIGRQAEMQALGAHFEAARTGHGRGVVIVADPGIGKSSLVTEFLESGPVSAVTSFVLQCAPEQRDTPLHPIRQYLEWVAGANKHDNAAARHAKLERLFSAIWGAKGEDLTMLLDLLSPLGSGIEADRNDSVPLRRQRSFELLCRMIFQTASARGAMVVVFEDAQWLDPSSAQLLQCLLEMVPPHPALVLVTTRREPPYGGGMSGAGALIALDRLGDADARVLARSAHGTAQLSEQQFALLIEKSDGVPLYIEEYGDMLAAAGPAGIREAAVPLTIGGLVQSKFDRLDRNARRFAQAGSAIGRTFRAGLIQSINDGGDISAPIAMLEAQKIITQRDGADEGLELSFSHALIRDAIYASLGRDERLRLHGAIADFYLSQGGGMEVAEHVLAGHLARAGRPRDAIERFLGAALQAAGEGAAGEALAHLEAALASVDALPSGDERDLLELRIRAVQGPTQMVTGGPGNPVFGATQARAMNLLDRLDLHRSMVPVIYNTALHAWATADLARAMRISDAISGIEAESPDDASYMAAHTMRGLVAWHQGRNDLAEASLRATVERHRPELHRDLYSVFLKEFGVFSLFYLGLTKTVQGDALAGAEAARRAAVLGAQMGFPHARGFGLLAKFNTAMLRGDVEQAASGSAEARDFALRQGFPEFAAMAQFVRGWCQVRQGKPTDGIADMEAGFQNWAATGFSCWQAIFAAILGRDLVTVGRVNDAETLIARFMTNIDQSGENQARAPLLLARAELLRALRQSDQARSVAAEALHLAKAQGAHLWADMIAESFSD